jgi:hypothetical protein
VRADEERPQLLEVTVVLVLDYKASEFSLGRVQSQTHTLGHSPEVFTTLDDAAVGGLDVLRGANDGEWDRVLKDASVLGALIVCLDRGAVDADALCGDDLPNLRQ